MQNRNDSNHQSVQFVHLTNKWLDNGERRSSFENIVLLYRYQMMWCPVSPSPHCPHYWQCYVKISRSRQPSAMPGPGVKTEIFKSKFDMIWTLIHLMFESKVGTVAREKISMKIGDLGVTRLHMNWFCQEIMHKELSKSFVKCLS